MPRSSVDTEEDREQRSRDRRADCITALAFLWDESSLKSIRHCSRNPITADGSVAVRSRLVDGRAVAGFAGLMRCGSVWSCPECSRKIAARRQVELEEACAAWERLGGALGMLTLTVSHRQGQSLKSVWDAVSAGWARVTSGAAWKRQQRTFGVEGWHRVVEVTHGANGWHCHIHVVLFLHHGLGPVERAALSALMLAGWRKGIGKHGFSASEQHGADVRMVHGADAAAVLADYFTKGVYRPDGSAAASVALEATRGDLKQGRNGSRTPFGVLYDVIRNGDADDLAVWHEWERGSHRRRQTAWSKGFRAYLELGAAATDEDIAAEQLGNESDDVVILEADTWRRVRSTRWVILDVVETCGVHGLVVWLDAHGLAWRFPARC
jgi:hypothetical protein